MTRFQDKSRIVQDNVKKEDITSNYRHISHLKSSHPVSSKSVVDDSRNITISCIPLHPWKLLCCLGIHFGGYFFHSFYVGTFFATSPHYVFNQGYRFDRWNRIHQIYLKSGRELVATLIGIIVDAFSEVLSINGDETEETLSLAKSLKPTTSLACWK